MTNPNYGISEAPPMWCNRCGARFNRMNTAASHHCGPNNTGFTPSDVVRVGTATGHVRHIYRGMVEVYFPRSYRTGWFTPDELERVS